MRLNPVGHLHCVDCRIGYVWEVQAVKMSLVGAGGSSRVETDGAFAKNVCPSCFMVRLLAHAVTP